MAAETPPTGMDRAEMKRLLLKSKHEPVNCAIGIGNDKSVALLMLARNRSSKSLQGDLQKDFPTAFNTRFGTAVVDTDDDPTLVKFMLNKAVTSMARRLVKTLKGTGFRKVQVLLEDGSPVEAAAEEEAAEQTNDGATSGAPKALNPVHQRVAVTRDIAAFQTCSEENTGFCYTRVQSRTHSAAAHGALGGARLCGGFPRRAVELPPTAMRLSPFDPLMPLWLHLMARAAAAEGRSAVRVSSGAPLPKVRRPPWRDLVLRVRVSQLFDDLFHQISNVP
jgi:hypothetical protein